MTSSLLRIKKTYFFILIFFIAALFSSCSSQNNSERIDLTKDWEYALSEKEVQEGKFSVLEASKLANLEELVPQKMGYIWLRKNFTVPASLQDKTLGIYLGRIALADKTFVNGVFVGGEVTTRRSRS